MSSIHSTTHLHAFWQPHATAWQNSGLSKARYCREHDLNYHQFIYWFPRFTPNDMPASGKKRSSKLLPVTMQDSRPSTGIRITLPNGVVIDGVTQSSVQILGAVVSQL